MTAATLRYLSRSDIAGLGGDRSDLYMEAVEAGFRLHAAGDFVQPLKPYLRSPRTDHIADRIIAMPAWIGGAQPMAGLKWIGSKHDNPSARGLPRAAWGGAVAHAGMGVMILGLAGMGLATDRLALLKPGESVALAGYEYRLEALRDAPGPNFSARRATLAVT